MKILCIDTSTRNNWVGVYVDNRLTDCVGYVDRQSCLINLIPSIQLLLDNAQIELSSIDGIVTIVGPGAWSSLRIGMATVKSLCLINQLPLITINNLDLIVETTLQVTNDASYIYAVMAAQNEKVYGALYEIRAGFKTRVSPYQWDEVDTVVESFPGEIQNLLVAGDATELFERHLRKGWETISVIPQLDSRYLSLLGELATAGDLTYREEDILQLKPLYIQPSSAEVEFKISVT